VSESVEQAATVEGWKARAEREAAAIIAQATPHMVIGHYPGIVELVAVGWLQGASFGAHDTLAHVDEAFERMRAAL
jgi:hypothetical protein